MNISNISWRGGTLDDVEILTELPSELVHLISETNGFILYEGALHVRGATLKPEWHSLRAALHGTNAFYRLYPSIFPTDIPFAQDQFGDQFLIRDGAIFRLFSETGEVEPLAATLGEFFKRIGEDIPGFLNVGLNHALSPGELLLAYPPFIFQESGAGTSLEPVTATEVIRFHADLARQMRDIPDGTEVEFRLVD